MVRNYLYIARWIFSILLGLIAGLASIFIWIPIRLIILGIKRSIKPQPSIHRAIEQDDLDEIKNYLGKGGNINAQDEQGRTPLQVAIHNKNQPLIDFLITCGADINLGDRRGQTPLYQALNVQQLTVVDHLLAQGATPTIEASILLGDVNAVRDFCQAPQTINKRRFGETSLLHLGARSHCSDIPQLLLDAGATINAKDSRGYTPLHLAAFHGNDATVRLLLERGADANAKAQRISTPLSEAVRGGHRDIVAQLLQQGAKVQQKADQVDGVLGKAVNDDRLDIVKLLVQYGANVNVRDGFPMGESPLHKAVKAKNLEMAALLLSCSANVNTKSWFPRLTPLEMAARQPEMLALLKQHGANIADGIWVAAQVGDIESIQDYLAQGGTVHIQHHDGSTLLHFAAGCGHDHLLQFLLEKGANPNIKNKKQATPLLCAAQYSSQSGDNHAVALLIAAGAIVDLRSATLLGNLDAVQHYLDQGGNVNAKVEGQTTLLQLAVQRADLDMVKFLLSRGATPPQAGDSIPMLMLALHQQDEEMIQLLFERGMSANTKVGWLCFGAPILHFVVISGNAVLTELLLRHGANVNTKGWMVNSTTPLHKAVQFGYLDVVNVLLDYGAKVNAPSRFSGLRPLQVCTHPDIAEILKQHGAI